MIAKNLGRGDREQASRTAGNAMFVTLCYFVLIFLFGLTSSEVFINSQTADTMIAEMGTTYLRIITVFSLGTLGYMCLEKIVMGTGKTTITMICQLAGALTNIVLDPVMIYGLLGSPAMGVAGAALATVIGQFVSLIVIAAVYFKKGVGLESGMRYLKPEKKTLGSIYTIGLPAIVMQILTPIMSYALNLILGTISVSAVTAYGVYYKLQNFIFMPGYGLNNASIPIISYNFGAKNKARVSQTIRYGLLYVLVIMLIGIILLQLFARQIVGIFSVTEESHQLCRTGFAAGMGAFSDGECRRYCLALAACGRGRSVCRGGFADEKDLSKSPVNTKSGRLPCAAGHFFPVSIKLRDDVHALVDADNAAVQRQVVVLGMTPLHIGVEAVIRRAALILIPHTLLRGLLPLTVDLHDALGTERHIRVDKDFQAVCLVPQNIVGTAANNDAGTLFRQLRDDLVLMLPENVLVGGAEHPVGKGRGQEAAGSVLARLLHIVRREAGLLRHFLNDLRVIAGDAQLFRYLFADGASAAAKLAADGDNSVFHAI